MRANAIRSIPKNTNVFTTVNRTEAVAMVNIMEPHPRYRKASSLVKAKRMVYIPEGPKSQARILSGAKGMMPPP